MSWAVAGALAAWPDRDVRTPAGLALVIYLTVVVVMSVVTAGLIVWDKRMARRQGRRVSEKTLHRCELLGGWPGSFLSRRLVRHKTHKRSYRLVYAAVVAVHVAVSTCLIFWWVL